MKRILTAIVLIAAVVALVFFGPLWSLTVASALVAALASIEYRGLVHKSGAQIPLPWLLAATATVFGVTMYLTDAELPILSLLAFALFAWAGFRAPLDRVLPDTAYGLFALIYIAYPLTLIPLIKAHEDGIGLLVFLFVCVWSGDIAALYIGRLFGKRKLAPRLSPGKTWAGSVASIVASMGFGTGIYYLGQYLAIHRDFTALHIAMPVWQIVLLAAFLNIAAQLGDLLESAIKRGAGVKDSGTMLPGHGGILDRIDALLLAAPALWYVLMLRDWQTLFR
ncbi:CDP-archaeol synthase [Granulicella sp. WH15]|uniref:phosphatidate cytidylyltransferase n=1 Tax=Granulicella sp. WH15 TaxID=2602070 RepID=UPI001366E13D|nr:CDP-archaeol synthase [Granulicella sp. WH15]QHN04383.1 CDP-archaeol synthase [Granulicella sp. WH15]